MKTERTGLGPEAEEEQPREGGHLDLGGRECLACFITHTSVPPGCTAASSSSDAQKADGVGGSKAARRNRRSGKTIAATAGGSRRGRSELYLVLDAKAFLLATPDRWARSVYFLSYHLASHVLFFPSF